MPRSMATPRTLTPSPNHTHSDAAPRLALQCYSTCDTRPGVYKAPTSVLSLTSLLKNTTHFSGLSLSPPFGPWQQHRIYLASASRSQSRSFGRLAVFLGPRSAASRSAQHPPTQWL